MEKLEALGRHRAPIFECLGYASLWAAQVQFAAMDLEVFKTHVAGFVAHTGLPVLGYLSELPDGTMAYAMSRYPDYRTDRPAMPSVAECNDAARLLAESLQGVVLEQENAVPGGLRAVIGLREEGYDWNAPIQDISEVVDRLPNCVITPAHMVARRFAYAADGTVVVEDYDEPVAVVETSQDMFRQVVMTVDALKQQHCPVEDFKRGVITMNKTRWATHQ